MAYQNYYKYYDEALRELRRLGGINASEQPSYVDYTSAYRDALAELERLGQQKIEPRSKTPVPKVEPVKPKQLSTSDKIKLGALNLAYGALISRFPRPMQNDFRKLFAGAEAVARGKVTAEELTEAITEKDKPQPYKGFFDAFGKSLSAGTGQTFQDIGHGLQWLGKEDVGKGFVAGGELVSAGKRVEGIEHEGGKVNIKLLKDPQWWATDMATSLPAQIPLMAAGIAPTIAGTALGGPIGGVAGAVAGTAISRPGESFLEAGQAYEAAKQLGYDEDIAKKVASKVYKENLKLSIADIPELVFTFAKVPKPLAKVGTTPLKKAMVTLGIGGTKVGIDVAKEAGEEFAQENIQEKALAQQPHSFMQDISRFARPSTWTPEESAAALAGGAMGGLFGGAGAVTDIVRTTMPQEVVSAKSAPTEIKGIDTIENKLVSEYGKLLDPEMVDSLIELKQSIPELEKQFGADSLQLAQAEAVRLASVGQMYMDVMAQVDSYLTEAQQTSDFAALQQLQEMKADMEQAAPQQLLDMIQEMQQQEEAETAPEEIETETEEVSSEVVPEEATIPEQAALQEETATPEIAPTEESADDVELIGDMVDKPGETIPVKDTLEGVASQEEVASQEAPEEVATTPQVGKLVFVTYKGETYIGEVIKAGKANAVIKTADGRQLTIPTKAEWKEIEATGGQVPETAEQTPEITLEPGAMQEQVPEAVPETAPEAPVTATYTTNEDDNTVVVKFPSKPAKEITDRLYTAGFKYSRKDKAWYAEQNPERIALAKELAGEKESEKKPETEPEKKPKKKKEVKPEKKPEKKKEAEWKFGDKVEWEAPGLGLMQGEVWDANLEKTLPEEAGKLRVKHKDTRQTYFVRKDEPTLKKVDKYSETPSKTEAKPEEKPKEPEKEHESSEEPETKPEKLSTLEQQLTEKGVEYTKDKYGNLVIGEGIVWAKDKWDRDTAGEGSVGIYASTHELPPEMKFKRISGGVWFSEGNEEKYRVIKEKDGTWSAYMVTRSESDGSWESNNIYRDGKTLNDAMLAALEADAKEEGNSYVPYFELESSFHDKDTIKGLGGKWGPQVRWEKGWFLPADKLLDLVGAFENVFIEKEAVELMEKPRTGIDETQRDPGIRIADFVTQSLKKGEVFNSKQLFKVADEAYEGTQAEGKYTPKDAYDAMELGVNKYLEQQGFNPGIGSMEQATSMLRSIQEDILEKVPTQTKRTEEQQAYQQFSTPPNIAFAAAWAANISPGETVLEPSAGIGGLAVFAKNAGAKVIVNELSDRRASLLKEMGFDRVFTENAEQIDNILPDDIKPTAVIMNPPFSATAGRMGAKKATGFAKAHVEQALRRLEPNGRLVAIVGRGMADNTAAFRDWWKNIKTEYNVLANIGIEGSNYRKYGTTFGVQLVVIDKTGPTKKATLTGSVDSLEDILPMLEGIRDERIPVDRQTESVPSKPDRQETPSETEGETRPGSSIHIPTDELGTEEGSTPTGGTEGLRPDGKRDEGSTGRPDVSDEPTRGVRDTDKGRTGQESAVGKPKGTDEAETGSSSGVRGEPAPSTETVKRTGAKGVEKTEISIEQIEEQVQAEEEAPGSVYAEYKPQKVRIPGAQPHPGDLVQSAAMAAVEPPDPTYTPNLPKDVITKGKLSDAQLEAVVYAGQNFEKFLPNGMRKGYFIGDGTGVGKGREISGIIMDSMRQGQTKAVWVSKSNDLIRDAKRDFKNTGGNPGLLFEQGKTKSGDVIKNKEGVVFTTYTTLGWDLDVTKSGDLTVKKGKHSRIDQLVEWLGEDFGGVIAFDEAHLMRNCIAQKKKRGMGKPAAMALAGIEIARKLPKARVVYLSATGGVEVSDLGYAERLGLWGEGTPFANKDDFIAKISSGGIAAMELVARDMKAMGDYISRNLSYNGVTFDTLEHQLDDIQTETYDTMARAWQVVLQNIDVAIKETGVGNNGLARGRVLSQFWSAQQRFFNQVLTAMQMPSAIKAINNDLKNERSVVLQLVNTNAAAQEREIAARRKRGDDLEDLDITPRGTLIEFLKKSFPVQQYEEYTDDNGNIRSRPVVDSQGNPVINKKAVARRDALIQKLGAMRIPDGPLDMLLNVFGVDNVAEITGRTRRVVKVADEVTGEKKSVLESRSVNHRRADVKAFMDGKKRILVFSGAGDTGASYHADRTAKNQQPRTHYLIQAGWSAPKAVQGFGRTHRTNQAHAPHYVLVTTNLKGQRRFISTIARRLDQLGALTKGQRQAGSQGMFSAADNLESDIARDALDMFYRNLVAGHIDGLPGGQELLKMLGLDRSLLDKHGNLLDTPDRRDTSRFLNRILVLESKLQNKVFDVYFGTVEAMTQRALEDGTLDVGMEDYRRDKIEIVNEKTVYTDSESGAETKYIELDAGDKSRPISFKTAKGMKQLIGFYQNKRSKRVYAFADSGLTTTLENGHVVRMLRRYGQELTSKETFNEEALTEQVDSGSYIKLTPEQAEPLWNEAYGKVPEYKMEKVHLISGALLPIWDRLPEGRMRVLRVRTDDGQVFLGRIVPPRLINTVLHKLGADTVDTKRSPQNILDAILQDGESFKLANGWELGRRRVAGEFRIELTGTDLWKYNDELVKAGVFTEEINYQVRYFIPVGDEGVDAIKKITARRPIIADSSTSASLDDVLNKFSDKVNEAMPEEPPKMGMSVYDVSRYERKKAKEKGEKRKPYSFVDPEIEKRWQNAKLPKETFLDRVKEFVDKAWRQSTREFEFLPDTPEFEQLRNKLLQLRNTRGVVREKTYRTQQGITINLDDYTFDIFTRKVILDDLVEDAKLGYNLPFGFTQESLAREHERINQETAKYPDAETAVKDRRNAWEGIKNDYIKAMADIGFDVEDRLTRENYFHHQVIMYSAIKKATGVDVRGAGQKVQKGSLKRRGFLKRRGGTELDFNTDYVVAEYEVMAQMLYDIKVAEVIKTVDQHYNIRKRLEQEAKARNQAAINRIIEDEIDKFGIGNSPTEIVMKEFAKKMAISFSELQKAAEIDKLWTGENGEWAAVIDRLALGIKDEPGERSNVFRYLSEVAKDENLPGNLQSRAIFKAIAERNAFIKETLGANLKTFEDIIPDGYTLHAIEEGHVFYFANAIPEHLANQVTDHMLQEVGISKEDIQRVRAVAGLYPAMVVKEEVALTLDNFRQPLVDNAVTQMARFLTRPWKIYVLTAPQKWFKYNARNISGDAEAVFVGNPSAFKKVPQAIKELYEVMFKDRPMSKDMREFFERGLFQTVLQAVEVGDLDQLKMFQHLYEKEQRYKKHGKLLAAPTKAWQTYWKYARLTTDFREAILRYAACLDYLEQMKDDPKGKPKSFGASKPENVMAMDNIYDRAFKLANELCGAYNRVGVIGQFLRENLVPFWSWNEVNFRRYIQLWRNMWNDGKFTEAVGRKTASKVAGLVIKSPVIAFRIGKITLATFAWTGLMMAWNNLLFGDEEDDLPKDVQLKPHLIFGRDKDGKVKYIDRLGMLDDFLEWFGLDEAGVYVYEFMNGRRSFKETVRDMVVAPFNKLAQGITPLIKLPFELITGASLYPDIKQPGHIYDKPEYFARQFGLADEYKAMRGKSRQPYGNTLQKWLILKADPGESAYYEIKDLKRDYMKEVLEKGSGAGYYDNSRSEALYNVKMALRYNDTKAFEKYLQEYVLLGGTSKGLNQSLRSLDPFYGLKGDEGKEFYDSLTPQEQVKAKRAMEFYRDVLLRTDDKKFDESAKKAVDRALKKLDEDY